MSTGDALGPRHPGEFVLGTSSWQRSLVPRAAARPGVWTAAGTPDTSGATDTSSPIRGRALQLRRRRQWPGTVAGSPAGPAARTGPTIPARAIAAQRVDLVYNPVRTGAASERQATVTVSQEQAPEPPGRCREVCERFPEGPGQMLTGARNQWPAGRSTRSRCSKNWPRLFHPREATATRWEK